MAGVNNGEYILERELDYGIMGIGLLNFNIDKINVSIEN